jgi:acyl-coenzyme A thioesterase PaaI-like protein
MNAFIKMARNPLKFRLFLLLKLPCAYFSGVRIKSISEEKCVVTVPYKWFSKNPFGSAYFACLAMAAEMSTGALCMANVYKRSPSVSMLITDMNAAYYKKATDITTFVCRDGIALRDAVEEAVAANGDNIITVQATGTNEAGELVAVFNFTWSFRVRTK